MICIKNFEIMQSVKFLSEEQIKKGLELTDDSGKNHLVHYAYILHDKDVKNDGTKKEAHWHILIKMDNNYTFKYIAKRFGVEEQYVEKIKSSFPKALNYLTHNNQAAKDEGKYLYEDDEVKSDYCWKSERRKAIDDETRKNRKAEIIEQITNGTIRRFNYTEYITPQENDKFSKNIEKAFKYRQDVIKKEARDMKVIYISGSSGSGKTTYAKEYAKKLGYSYYVSSGSNDVLDGYEGQDCLILDELRPSCLGLSDLLKLLDNHTNSSIKSRYFNKTLECKLVIITSIYDIDTFFKNVFKEDKEPIKQLYRRCQTKIRMTDNKMYISLYDELKEMYCDEIEKDNPIQKYYVKKTYKSKDEYEKEIDNYLL